MISPTDGAKDRSRSAGHISYREPLVEKCQLYLVYFQGHTIQALVRMLGHPKDTIVKYALSTLYNLIAYNKDEVAGAIRLAGGVKRMSALISPKGFSFYIQYCL